MSETQDKNYSTAEKKAQTVVVCVSEIIFTLQRINKAIKQNKKQERVKDGNVAAYFLFSQFGCGRTWSCPGQRNPALATP